jgi:hypothetical protein
LRRRARRSAEEFVLGVDICLVEPGVRKIHRRSIFCVLFAASVLVEQIRHLLLAEFHR